MFKFLLQMAGNWLRAAWEGSGMVFSVFVCVCAHLLITGKLRHGIDMTHRAIEIVVEPALNPAQLFRNAWWGGRGGEQRQCRAARVLSVEQC